ncbi:hypothetical protein CFAM422_010456 [Trichoderma lentiforme]|uniref:RCC1-like domain-containing protein n=1 Tax=Trichoderma lentiforme TaxID=1567552 RepID=A0A9P4X7K4_9HYPO|nr:hypothetical protein CFAM422_010456 [Trichoderma lentiforme]
MEAIYAIGSNGSGQLGISHKEDVSVPKPALFHPEQPSSRIVKVVAGGNHTLLLTESGKLYWSGDPASGACGLKPFPNIPVFLEARLAKEESDEQVGEIALVAATWEASVVVSKDDQGKRTKVFSLGIGQKGELGLGELIVRTPSATKVKDFPPAGTEIVDLSACMGHVVAVLDNGDVYGWGNCRKSQIGEPAAVVYTPRKIEGVNFKVVRAVCAKESTCLFGEPGSGNLHVLGSDKWDLISTAPSTAPAWKDVGASWGNFYILGQDGSLTAWGRDDHGQLPPSNLPSLEKVAIGSEHVVALTADGDVLSWGWGEHGNCGPQVENNDVKGRWNVIASSKLIPPESKIDNIGAGCATSWISITSS